MWLRSRFARKMRSTTSCRRILRASLWSASQFERPGRVFPGLFLCSGLRSGRSQDPLQLLSVEFQATFGPDDVIGPGEFLLDGQLCPVALVDLFSGPAAGQKTIA